MKNNVIRRTVCINSPINKIKYFGIKRVLLEYNNCVNYFIKRLWSEKKLVGGYLNRNYIDASKKYFGLTVRMLQCASIQAFEIVKSQRKLSKRKRMMPRFRKLTIVLNQNLWKVTDKTNSFYWIKLQSGFCFYIPFKKSKLWDKWISEGFSLSKSMHLSLRRGRLVLGFIFEKEKPQLKTDGKVEGIDLGYVDVLTCSDGQVISKDMSKYIKSFKKREKNTYIQAKQKMFHDLKQLDLSNIKTLIIENLRSVKSGKRGMFSRKHNRRLSHWLYAKATKWIEQRCEELGVRLVRVSPYKTSQFCRFCNKWDRRNRKGKVFQCISCGHTDDADMNSAQNMKLLGLAGAYSLRLLENNFCNCASGKKVLVNF